jgi:hypothetical protein
MLATPFSFLMIKDLQFNVLSKFKSAFHNYIDCDRLVLRKLLVNAHGVAQIDTGYAKLSL